MERRTGAKDEVQGNEGRREERGKGERGKGKMWNGFVKGEGKEEKAMMKWRWKMQLNK